jgi:predicted RNA binding protein YcfA (HicA-like mRNA interferase family)
MCKVLERRGWRLARTKSSHHIYKKKPGVAAIITVPVHGNKDLRKTRISGFRRLALGQRGIFGSRYPISSAHVTTGF